MRPYPTSVCGLKLLVYAGVSYYVFDSLEMVSEVRYIWPHIRTHASATHSGGTLDPDVLLPDDALRAPQAVSSEKHHVGAVH